MFNRKATITKGFCGPENKRNNTYQQIFNEILPFIKCMHTSTPHTHIFMYTSKGQKMICNLSFILISVLISCI